MYKAFKAIQRSYVRAPYRAFMVSQKQHDGAANVTTSKFVPNRAVSMKHETKAGATK